MLARQTAHLSRGGEERNRFAYLGGGEPPAFRRSIVSTRPRVVFAFKGHLTATGCRHWKWAPTPRTPASSSILRRRRYVSANYGRQFRAASADRHAHHQVLRELDRPDIRVEHTDRPAAFALRELDEERCICVSPTCSSRKASSFR